MKEYNYYEAIKADIKDYIEENEIKASDYEDFDRMNDRLYDDLWVVDNVTGNGSGSYTFNAYEAEEYVGRNLGLLVLACEEFGCDVGEAIRKGSEHCDVTIRCYLLGIVLSEVLEELFGSEFENREEDGE